MNPKIKSNLGDGCAYLNYISKGVIGASNVTTHVSRKNECFSPEEISKMEDLYRLKGEELIVTKGLATKMSEKKEFVESQVKKLRVQMEDMEVTCAETKMDLHVTINKLNVHKKYMDNFLEPTTMLPIKGMEFFHHKMPSKIVAKLDTLIREVE
jgi:hypothetical protein